MLKKRATLFGILLLAATTLPCPIKCSANEPANLIRSVLVNNVSSSSALEVLSPFVSLSIDYQMNKSETMEWLRIYRGHGCSLAEPFHQFTWCESSPCTIGEYRDFDLSFDSNGNFFFIPKRERKSLPFSVELATTNIYGIRTSTCRDETVTFAPCDEIVKEELGAPSSDYVVLRFIDKNNQRPVEKVEILLSSGPTPHFVETAPGIVEMRTVARSGYKFSFSRGKNHRFVVGPYQNQLSKDRLKNLTVALCTPK